MIFRITNTKTNEVKRFMYEESIYDYIAEEVLHNKTFKLTEEEHIICADAESWCRIASVEEVYEGEGFTIEVIED